jgi:hypothetical protein
VSAWKAGRGVWRAFEGPNGWYVACPLPDGSHKQPDHGGRLSRKAAEAEAARKNAR